MNKYEFVYIVDAHATQGVKDEIAKQVNDAIAKSNIKVINAQVWMERHRMAFPINKIWEGTYYLMNLESPAAGMNKLQSILRINDQILRCLAVKPEVVKAAA